MDALFLFCNNKALVLFRVREKNEFVDFLFFFKQRRNVNSKMIKRVQREKTEKRKKSTERIIFLFFYIAPAPPPAAPIQGGKAFEEGYKEAHLQPDTEPFLAVS